MSQFLSEQSVVRPSSANDEAQSVEILKSQHLGAGGFGAVCKARIGQLCCAAKILHPLLFGFKESTAEGGSYNPSLKLPLGRFMQECEFLSSFQHPHIIQYLGTHCDPDTNAPILLMELMDESLTDFLANSPTNVPYHIQVSISSGIAQALSYLHNCKRIIHRDLSSNNILLLAGRHAKVTDFGMSKIAMTAHQQRKCAAMTVAPGTLAYMPPESFEDHPSYTEKLDCFSLGVLIVQILTREFPDPTERYSTIEVDMPQSPSSEARKVKAKVPVSEVERRSNHISLIEPGCGLLKIALDCLRDQDSERPSANEVCLEIEKLRASESYKASSERSKGSEFAPLQVVELQKTLQDTIKENQSQLRKVEEELEDKKREIQELNSMLVTQEREIIVQSDQIIAKIMSDKDELIDQRDRMLRERDVTISSLKTVLLRLEGQNKRMTGVVKRLMTSLEESNRQLKHKDNTIDELEAHITALKQPPQHLAASRRHTILRYFMPHFSSCEIASTSGAVQITKAPISLNAGSSAVIGSKAYFAPAGSSTVLEYDTQSKLWSELPKCPVSGFTIASVEGLLTAVGGWDSSKVYTLSEEEDGQKKWIDSLPPMGIPRAYSIVVSTETALIVAGGDSTSGRLSAVEVLDLRSRQWAAASPLPHPLFSASATICRGRVYFVGGFDENGVATTTVLVCSLERLVKSAKVGGAAALVDERDGLDLSNESLTGSSKHSLIRWSRLADLPVHSATCTTFESKLIVIGGIFTQDKMQSSMIYSYSHHPMTDTWEAIGEIATARSRCLVAAFSDQPTPALIVAGGLIGVSATDEVDIVTDIAD